MSICGSILVSASAGLVHDHQGTPIPKARAAVVQSRLLAQQYFDLIGVPRLSENAHKVYEKNLPERLKQFPQSSVYQHQIPYRYATMGSEREQFEWSHELRHDAGSAFRNVGWILPMKD